MLIKLSIWEKIYPIMKHMHWKVQNGLIFWFAMQVNGEDWETDVLDLLTEMKVSRARNKKTVCKVFSEFSKLFKKIRECKSLIGFKERFGNRKYMKIPPEVMIDIETSFGFYTCNSKEIPKWDQDISDNLIQWLGKDSSETFMGRDITLDYKSEMQELFAHIKRTKNEDEKGPSSQKQQIFVSQQSLRFLERRYPLKIILDTLQEARANEPPKMKFLKGPVFKRYFFKDEHEEKLKKSEFVYKSFYKYSTNFLNFSVGGSAYGMHLSLIRSKEFEELKTQDPDEYKKVNQKLNLKTPNPFSDSDSEPTTPSPAPKPRRPFKKKLEKQTMIIAPGTDEIQASQKSISKTACFGLTGHHGLNVFYWADKRGTQYNLSLKLENKKIRMVANADLISFVKQTYLYNWIIGVLHDNVRSKIQSLLTEKERIRGLTRMSMSDYGEKWCLPVDLKDFHEHFGKSQLTNYCDILLNLLPDIDCKFVRDDMNRIILNLKEDFKTGILEFKIKSEEKNLFKKINQNAKNLTISFNKCEDKRDPTMTRYSFQMEVKNGLMSGWKMTSLLGSMFNLALNRLCQRWSLLFSQNINSDVNVLGDDTHLKCRYLSHCLDQIDMINLIGKRAHPQKQMISSVYTEFLKKTINTLDHSIIFSANRMNSSLLWDKNSNSSNRYDKGKVRELFETTNIYLSRLTLPSVRNKILRNKYFEKSFTIALKMHNKTDKLDIIKTIIDSPTQISGILAGFMRRTHFYRKQRGDQDFDTLEKIDLINDFKVKESPKILVLNSNYGKWRGTNLIAKKFVGKVLDLNKGQVSNSQTAPLCQKISQILYDEINEDNCKHYNYKNPNDTNKDLVQLIPAHEMLDDPEQITHTGLLYGTASKDFNIPKFLEFFFNLLKMILWYDHDLVTLIGELIIHTEKLTAPILNEIRKSVVKSHHLFRALISFQPDCPITDKLYEKIGKRLGSSAFIRLTTCNELKVSCSRKLVIDEYLGFVNTYMSTALVFYLLEVSNESFIQKKNFVAVYRACLHSLDYFLNDNCDFLKDRLLKLLKDSVEFLELRDYNSS